ncbi:MBL fold metallo-hydrolase [Vibrio parahaemolyticus]|nr:MBL fold metallo-hydrolase [Vibrio parahaemolyticus]
MSNEMTFCAFNAANGDCLLLIDNNTGFSILVDAGPKKSAITKRISNQIRSLVNNRVDLAIVTHNDDDHIGGFKKLLSSGLEIDKFIFNSHDLIDKIISNSRETKVSFRQDRQLRALLENNKIEKMILDEDGYFENKTYANFELSFHSPNKEKLEKYKKWLDKEENKYRDVKVSKSCDSYSREQAELLSKSDDGFIEDNREPNGSSLAIDIKIGRRRFLLLGDSHPTVVIDSLSKLKHIPEYDLVKLSHHGSSKNTSNRLLNSFTSNNYLICSDANSNHGHPSLVTIARVLNLNRTAKIYITEKNPNTIEIENEMNICFNYPKEEYIAFKYEY